MNSVSFANWLYLSIEGVYLARKLGGFVFRVDVKCKSNSRVADDFTLTEIGGQLHVSCLNQFILVGNLQPTEPVHMTTQRNEYSKTYRFEVPVTDLELEEIQQTRTKDVTFKAQFWIVFSNESGKRLVESSSSMSDLRIPQSDWIEALNRVDFQKNILFEINAPFDSTETETSLLEKLQLASQALQGGEIETCLLNCRKAIENLEQIYKLSFDFKNKNSKEFSKEERFRSALKNLKNIASAAAHDDEFTKDIRFNRLDAQCVFTNTLSFVQWWMKQDRPKE